MKVTKTLLISSLLLFLSYSCSNDTKIENDIEEEIASTNSSIIPRTEAHDKYKEIGWGINMSGNYFKVEAQKYPILDIERFDRENNNIIKSDPQKIHSESDHYYGATATEYIKNVEYKASGSYNSPSDTTKTKKGGDYSGSITGSFKNKTSYSSNYSFASYNLMIISGHASIIEDISLLKKYVFPNTQEYIDTYPPEFIFSQLGTHVITDATFGANLNILYRSEDFKETKERTTKIGLKGIISGFGLGGDYEKNVTTYSYNAGSHFTAQSNGGGMAISLNMSMSDGKLGNFEAQQLEWAKSVTFKNSVVIKFNSTIPIYEFASTVERRETLKSALEAYLIKQNLELLTPLYHFNNMADNRMHYYSIYPQAPIGEYDSAGSQWGSKNLGIACYVHKDNIPGTVPLYVFQNQDDKRAHYYTTTLNAPIGGFDSAGSKYGSKNMGVACYVYKDNRPGTVPLYAFQSQYNKRAHYYTIYPQAPVGGFDSSGSVWGSKNMGVACYVYKDNIE